jgi:hypothetical protein
MSAAYDPFVARALDQLVAGVASDPDEMLRRARLTVEDKSRRRAVRLRRAAIVAFAALALLSGAAFAATRFDILPWVDRSNRSNATFSIDPSRTYRGPAAEVLVCPRAGAGFFFCSVGSAQASTARIYHLTQRVEAQPQVTRDSTLRALAVAENEGRIDHASADRVRRDLEEAGDEFFSGMALLAGVETIGAGEQAPGRPGFELVPPVGVPMWVACAANGGGFRCHDLAALRDVAAGTPLYLLQTSRHWVAVPRESQRPVDVDRLFRAVLGRDLTPAEARLLVVFMTAGDAESQGGTVQPVPLPPKNASP